MKKNNVTEPKSNSRLPEFDAEDGLETGVVPRTPQIWKNRISWRITLTVFLVILLVQGICLYSYTENYETRALNDLRVNGETILLQHIIKTSATTSGRKVPINTEDADRMFNTSVVKGLAIYSLDGAQLAIYGTPPTLQPQRLNEQTTYRSVDLRHYDVIYAPSSIETPFIIVATLDSSGVQADIQKYVRDSLIIFTLTSGLVTSILMIALSQWLLQPILTLRKNLLNAARNPKNPEILGAGQEGRDEIGITLRIANGLIRKHASNIRQMEMQTEERIHRLAYYDALTGLPNRALFVDTLEEMIKRKVRGEGQRVSIFFFDLDHFGELNATMGHEIGDRLLEAVGRRLSGALSPDSLVARMSGDQFAIVTVPDYADETGAAALETFLRTLDEPVNILQEEFKVRVSVGVATCPSDGKDARQLLKNADIALNRAKSEGRDTVRFYAEDLDLEVQKRFRLLGALREALHNGELKLNFHPQFDLASGTMTGAEALLRWEHADNSAEGSHEVPPDEFLKIAEQTGLIIPIGEFVLRSACRTNLAWRAKGCPAIRVAVNISAVQFHHGDIVHTVARVLRETGMEARYLELEITESVFMEDMAASIEILRQLHELGVKLAIDDFGTGYSSLSSLRQFPVDRLKIDPVFIRNALINAEDAAIVKTIITLGHSLGIKVLAEGVETTYHAAFLRQEGCDEAQGFKYTRPLTEDNFLNYAITYSRDLLKASLYVIDGNAAS